MQSRKKVTGQPCSTCQHKNKCPLQKLTQISRQILCPYTPSSDAMQNQLQKLGRDFTMRYIEFIIPINEERAEQNLIQAKKNLEETERMIEQRNNNRTEERDSTPVNLFDRPEYNTPEFRARVEEIKRQMRQEVDKRIKERQAIIKQLPPATLLLTYPEILELAFDPNTSDREAIKAKNALIRARKKYGDCANLSFQVPFFPATGSIIINKLPK
jgi:hypothetical protein